ncbi:hypothetical protein [Leeuwenhoekiella sp. W20_SRS_FM14]|uniref:hypothetical protein n=1 Tax=Leeuwenhoekiella sp. W20_SRS_FM14 TaxID=3240270 RepID=UPI003F958AF4
MKKIIVVVMALIINGVFTSCTADAYEEQLIHDTRATEGDDGKVTPPPLEGDDAG